MGKCQRCDGTGSIDCYDCGGSGDYNDGGEVVPCLTCGHGNQPAGQVCCPEDCDEGWVDDGEDDD